MLVTGKAEPSASIGLSEDHETEQWREVLDKEKIKKINFGEITRLSIG